MHFKKKYLSLITVMDYLLKSVTRNTDGQPNRIRAIKQFFVFFGPQQPKTETKLDTKHHTNYHFKTTTLNTRGLLRLVISLRR